MSSTQSFSPKNSHTKRTEESDEASASLRPGRVVGMLHGVRKLATSPVRQVAKMVPPKKKKGSLQALLDRADSNMDLLDDVLWEEGSQYVHLSNDKKMELMSSLEDTLLEDDFGAD